jgi:hypothetical protein
MICWRRRETCVYVYVCVWVWVCVCGCVWVGVRACARVRARVCVCVCVCVSNIWACVFAAEKHHFPHPHKCVQVLTELDDGRKRY